MRYRTCFLAITLSLCAPTESALAQPDDIHAQAEDRFRLGREALNRGDHWLALRLFRTSHGLEPGRGKLLNIAICEERLGLFASAFKHLQEVLPQFPAEDDRAPVVKQQLDAVSPKVPYLKIQLTPRAPSGTTVTLDGEPLAPESLGVDMPIDPGRHVVAAAAGATEQRYPLTLTAGEHRALEVTLPAGMPEPSGSAPDTPAPRNAVWTLGIIALGVGGVSLAAGAGTGAAAMAKRASTVELCPRGPTLCPASVQPDIDAYDRLGAASTATFILGGALVTTGVVLVVTARRGEKPAASAWVAPVLGLGVLGAQGGF